MKLKIIFIFFNFFSASVFAQEELVINTAGFRFLDYKFQLPEDLLSSKSIVFVSVPPKTKNTTERGDWKAFSENAHLQFRKMGIDAIGYYYIDDLKAGRDASITFAKSIKKRNVKNIILLSQVLLKVKGKEANWFVIVITPFNGGATYMKNGQKAWKTQNKDIKKVFKVLGKEVYKSKQPKTNFLITDLPEFFTDTDMIYGRRFGVNCRDLKVDKLCIPKFKKIEIPKNRPGGLINKNVEKEIKKYNAQVDNNNAQLEKIIKDYPFEYRLSDAKTDDDFYREGFQYVLLKLNTSGVTIKELLNFKVDYTETDYITIKSTEHGTTLRSIPVNASVNKYYVKHLYTKDVYTGAKWDADETWQDALKNFIRNMKNEFNIR